MREPRSTWTFTHGLSLVRSLQVETSQRGWHIGLAGGVLHKGGSSHDIDVIAFPHCRGTARPSWQARARLEQALRACGLTRTFDAADVKRLSERWKKSGDRKHVEVWHTREGRRVDLLVLS